MLTSQTDVPAAFRLGARGACVPVSALRAVTNRAWNGKGRSALPETQGTSPWVEVHFYLRNQPTVEA